MSDYEKQLEEANQKLREQLEKETERADKLEAKLKVMVPGGEALKYQAKILERDNNKLNEYLIKKFSEYKVQFERK